MGGLLFPHHLVVTPSASLGSYNLTYAAWFGIGISAFTEFTRFYNVQNLNVIFNFFRMVTEGSRNQFRKNTIGGWHSDYSKRLGLRRANQLIVALGHSLFHRADNTARGK